VVNILFVISAFNFYITRDYREGELTILDKEDDSPIYQAMVTTLQGEAGLTNEEGKILLKKIPPGWWSFLVEHDDYFSNKDSLFITSETIAANIKLFRNKANIILIISDENGPVPNARIEFNSWSAKSNIDGMAWFYFLTNLQEYSYSIETDNHETVVGSLYLERDSTVNIELSLVSAASQISGGNFQVYPNPAFDKLYIELDKSQGELSLLQPDGKIIGNQKVFSTSNIMDVSDLVPGLYYLKFKSGNTIHIEKIVISRQGL